VFELQYKRTRFCDEMLEKVFVAERPNINASIIKVLNLRNKIGLLLADLSKSLYKSILDVTERKHV
jgi:hypothetical protein